MSTNIITTKLQKEIEDYMIKNGGISLDWYVGISKDAEDRLFNGHNVSRHGTWIYGRATSSEEAREIEQYFIEKGTDGGPGGGDDSSDMVYAYKKTFSTNP